MRKTLASLVSDWRELGSQTAVITHRGNRSFRSSYQDLADLAGRFAAELARRNIQPGERVVLWAENSPEWIAAFFGCLLRGVLAVPLDAAGSASLAERVLSETSPQLVVGDEVFLRRLPEATPRLRFESFASELPAQPEFQVADAVVEDAPFQIVFTSGTTSEPKGVVHTHRNVLASLGPIEAEIAKYRRYERWVRPLRFLHTLPFSHVFGQFMGLWIPAILGAEVHLPSGNDPDRFVAVVRRERISVIVAVPRVLELLRNHLLYRFPGLQSMLATSGNTPAWKRWWRYRRVHASFGFKFWALVCGGATLPPDVETFWNGLGFALIQGYGMTETAALVTLNHPFKVGKGTLGKALPGREVRLSPEGEILVRGDMLAAGFWRQGRFAPRKEEWLATGDLATQDASGELRFTGRQGDVIVTAAGMNVYPQDLEAAMKGQLGVRGCVVVGCDIGGGQEPVAVVLFDGDAAELREVLIRANENLSPYQQMRRTVIWPEPGFPHTSSGKLLRRAVAERACAELQGTTTRGGTAADALLGIMEEITHERTEGAGEQSRLTEDLHLDSLGRVQLQSTLEQRFGVEIADERMASVQTLGELRALTQGRRAIQQTLGTHAAESSALQVPAITEGPKALAYARWPWSAPVRWLRTMFLEVVATPLTYLLAKPKVVYDAQLSADAPMLVIANHVNTYDVPVILYALPGRRRKGIAVAMSGEVLSDMRSGRGQGNALLNLLARPAYWILTALFNVFPLPRLAGFRNSFAHAGQALDRGYSVLVFPEGRRGWSGELQPFRPGIGLLVQASQVPVLPVAIQGAGAKARPHGRWFRPPELAIRVGQPIKFSAADSPEAITRQLEDALRSLGPS